MVSFYKENYPRPQFVRENWKNLNGIWNFAFDDGNVGEKDNWHMAFPGNRTIRVPFSYETALSGIGDETVHNVVWYQRRVDVSGCRGRTLLHFEGVDYRAKVWVDGVYMGCHEGGYSRFSFDVTDAVRDKTAVSLTVRAEDGLETDQPRGKQRYRKESWGCWYVQTTGIWKTVWMESLPESHLLSVDNTPDAAAGRLDLEVEAALPEAEPEDAYAFAVSVTFAGAEVVRGAFPLEQNPLRCSLELKGELRLWSPRDPALYEIRYELKKNGQTVDTVMSYFGLRTFETRGDRILLNGEDIFLRMVLDQGYWKDSGLTPPDEQALIKDIDLARSFGYNGLRKHQKIEDERFLYWCDVKGMLVWSEMAACYSFSDRAVRRFTTEWIRIVRQNKTHPCICVWVPFNESWGLPGLKDSTREQSFVNGIYCLTKALDGTRPVVTNDGWEHTVSDIVTIHDYREYGSELEQMYLDDERAVLNNRKSMSWYGQLAFAGDFRYNGQPVILSEYGGIALKSHKGWGYGSQAASQEAFWERFGSQNEAIRKIPYFRGFCYTQLTDVQQEVNGLVDMDRNPKFSAEMIEKIRKSNENTGKR